MAKLTCKFNIGTLIQQVFIQGRNTPGKKATETYWMKIDTLSDFIVNQADVDEVYLSGPSKFIERIEQEVKGKKTDSSNIKFIYI